VFSVVLATIQRKKNLASQTSVCLGWTRMHTQYTHITFENTEVYSEHEKRSSEQMMFKIWPTFERITLATVWVAILKAGSNWGLWARESNGQLLDLRHIFNTKQQKFADHLYVQCDKKKNPDWPNLEGWGCSLVVECLPDIHKTLDSVLSTTSE
jgi:hypothetical protein